MDLKINAITKLEQRRIQKNNLVNKQKNNQNNTNKLSNIYFTPVFQRKWKEHKSWGAIIDPNTKEATFKIFTFPDAKKVDVVVVKKDDKTNTTTYPLKNYSNGVFATEEKIPKGQVQSGDTYYFLIEKQDGSTEQVKDPYSFYQDKLLDESVVYDHSEYKWSDNEWFCNNKNRISRKSNSSNQLKSPQEARIFEVNIATLTQQGDFRSAQETLENIKKLGFNAIEIMPVENTYSFNWGYDGVDKHAVSKTLGGPDGLKAFVDAAHKVGLNVIIDFVPNHLGPDGASLKRTGPYIKGTNDFGESFNFDGTNSKYVRDYIVNAALNWIDNYHCDGLRLDMTKYMESDSTLKQIAAEVNYHKPDVFLIAEDSRNGIEVDGDRFWQNHQMLHDKRVVNSLKPFEYGMSENERKHQKAIEDIECGNTSFARLGYDSEWDFPYFHITKDALYGNVNLDKLEQMLLESQSRVKYILSHDEKGNYDGTALAAKLIAPMLHIKENITLNEQDNKRISDYSALKGCSFEAARDTITSQKAQLASEKLAIMLQTGELDKYENDYEALYQDILSKLDIVKSSEMDLHKIRKSFNQSFAIIKMAMARTFATPGPKMVFQGDENFDLTPFRFFRQFESIQNEDYLYVEKGYKQGLSALNESKRGNIKYNPNAQAQMNQFSNLMQRLNRINEENPALTKGQMQFQDTIKHHGSQVLATHYNYFNNNVFVVTNYSNISYPQVDSDKYHIQFPKGSWQEILNTDSSDFGGNNNINKYTIESNGHTTSGINLSNNSTIIFKKV